MNISKPLEIIQIEGKGRGVISTEAIYSGQYVTEYKYYAQYPLSDKSKYLEEYEANGVHFGGAIAKR